MYDVEILYVISGRPIVIGKANLRKPSVGGKAVCHCK